MIWIPFIGALSEAAGTILEKKVLLKRKINYKDYTVFGFLVIAILIIPVLFFFWRLDQEALTIKNILIFLSVVITSIIANLLCYYSLKREKVTELEPLRLLQPLFIVFLAFILYDTERKLSVLVAALIASLALIFSHVEKHHLKFNKYLITTIFSGLFFAAELVISKIILPYYSPLTFYFLRCTFIFLITAMILKPSPKNIDKTSWILIFITGAIWIVYRGILYYGYLTYGIVFTTLLFILAPIFIYLFAKIFLKEKLTWRNIIAAIIIVVCISYVIWMNA